MLSFLFFIIMKCNLINKEIFYEEWEIPKGGFIKYSLSTNLENKQLVPRPIEILSQGRRIHLFFKEYINNLHK